MLIVITVISTMITMGAAGMMSQFLEKRAQIRKEKREMQQTLFAISLILLTIAAYFMMNRLYVRFSFPLLLPVLTTTIILILLLTIFDISYSNYMIGGQWIHSLLGPAVVALAYPLYKQRHIVVSYWFPIISGVFVGLITGMISVLLFARALGIDQTLILSMLPKSLTTPVALQVSEVLGGIPPMTSVFVMIAGFSGVILWANLHEVASHSKFFRKRDLPLAVHPML